VIPPVIWIPAAFAVGLALVLWGGMSWAYERGGRHVREELEADRAARAFRSLPRVPAHNPDRATTVLCPSCRAPVGQSCGPGVLCHAARVYAWKRSIGERPERAMLAIGSGPLPREPKCPDEWDEHERQALQVANGRPEPDEPSDFTRGMAAMVAEGMAAVDAYLEGWQP